MITGGLGHIGSKLIHSLEKNNYEKIIIIDNLLTQRFPSLFNLPNNINYQFIDKSILDINLTKLTNQVDAVVHLAAITDATASFNNSEEVEKVNHEGTKLIANACIETQTNLLFPSTTSVYGSQSEEVDEDCPIEDLKPQSPYAKYKLQSENMLKRLGQDKGLKFITCRFGTIFGVSIGMRFHTAVNKFCWQAVMGKPLTVWKTAMNQKRPYLGINDAVDAIKLIINKDIFDCEIYNVVSSNNTVKDILNIIEKKISPLNIELVESKIMNQLSYNVLNNKFEKKGFKPKDLLSQQIYETIDLLSH